MWKVIKLLVFSCHLETAVNCMYYIGMFLEFCKDLGRDIFFKSMLFIYVSEMLIIAHSRFPFRYMQMWENERASPCGILYYTMYEVLMNSNLQICLVRHELAVLQDRRRWLIFTFWILLLLLFMIKQFKITLSFNVHNVLSLL